MAWEVTLQRMASRLPLTPERPRNAGPQAPSPTPPQALLLVRNPGSNISLLRVASPQTEAETLCTEALDKHLLLRSIQDPLLRVSGIGLVESETPWATVRNATSRLSAALGPSLHLTEARGSHSSCSPCFVREVGAEVQQGAVRVFKQRYPSFWAGSLGKGPHVSTCPDSLSLPMAASRVPAPDLGHTPPCSNERGLEATGVIIAAGPGTGLRGAGSACRCRRKRDLLTPPGLSPPGSLAARPSHRPVTTRGPALPDVLRGVSRLK